MRSTSDSAALPPHVFQILLALADRDLHGLAVMNDVLDRTGGQMRLWPGMLYRNLARSRRSSSSKSMRQRTPSPEAAVRATSASPRSDAVPAAEAQRLAAFVEVARRKKVIKA